MKTEWRFRFVSNGLKYRLQWWGKNHFWQRPKWRWVYRIHPEGGYIAEWDTIQEAERALVTAHKQFEAKARGWQPI